jgi:hypothetical protein
MEDKAMPKRMLKGRLYSKRRKGRPRMRWLDDIKSDLKMTVKGWKEKMEECRTVEIGCRGEQGSPSSVAARNNTLIQFNS